MIGMSRTELKKYMANLADDIKIRTPPVRDCYGGYVRHWDTDYPCPGCAKCRPDSLNAWAVGAFVWHVANASAHHETRQALTGLESLARIGLAVESALMPGLSIQMFVEDCTHAYNVVRKGNWYRVSGRRGNARNALGVEGECVWVGDAVAGAAYGRELRTYTRVGLQPRPPMTVVWLSAGQIERIPTPPDAALVQLLRSSYKKFDGKKGDYAYYIEGPNHGRHGRVFWIGKDRLGLKDHKTGEALWGRALDCSADKPASIDNDLVIHVEIAIHAMTRIAKIGIDYLQFNIDLQVSRRADEIEEQRRAEKRAERRKRRQDKMSWKETDLVRDIRKEDGDP